MQKMSRSFYQRLQDLESKGIIRRVRTPAGVRKYGQPIGTIIKPDLDVPAMARAPKGAKKVKADRAGNRGLKQYMPTKRIHSLDEIPMVAEDVENSTAQHEVGLFGAHTVTKRVGDNGVVSYGAYIGRTFVANYIDYPNEEGSDHNKREQDRFLATLNKYRDKPAPQRKPRETNALWDYWEGTYGWDWQNEGDDIAEEDFDDPLKRMEFAVQESKELGIEIGGYMAPNGEYVNFDVGVHEVINSNMRTYMEMYPGFTNLISKIGIERMQNSGTFAYNATTPVGERQMGTKIMFNSSYFAEADDDEALNRFAKLDANAGKTGEFFAENLEKMAEDMDMELWQVATLTTLNHEIGHTIGRMIFGEINNDHSTLYGKWEGIDSAAWREEYSANVTPILEKYGMAIREDSLDNADTTDNWITSFGKPRPDIFWSGKFPKHNLPPGFRKDLIAGHVSRYGATNLHEIMAETWASYMMEEEPTEFVQELGEAMENMMMLWLEEAGLSE